MSMHCLAHISELCTCLLSNRWSTSMLLAGNVLPGSSYVLYCQQEKELAGFTVVLVFGSIFIYIKKIDLEIFLFRLHDLFLLES